jgi:hypothetical protein
LAQRRERRRIRIQNEKLEVVMMHKEDYDVNDFLIGELESIDSEDRNNETDSNIFDDESFFQKKVQSISGSAM